MGFICGYAMSWFFRRTEKKDKKACIMRNGKILLENLIASSFGKRNPFRHYCCEELKTATNNNDSEKIITTGLDCRLYKGFLHNRSISVMTFTGGYGRNDEFCFNNIIFASQMNHKSLLILLGCCLETQTPILVFESVEGGSLADRIYRPHFEPLLFTHRLKIAMDVANAIAYLHVGLSRPIIFRDIKPSYILFDDNNVPKLFDYSLCKPIPEGETFLNVLVEGTYGFISPEYHMTGVCNEKSDVYSFGVLLLVLLTGKKTQYYSEDPQAADPYSFDELYDVVGKHFENNRINEIVDPTIIKKESYPGEQQQFQAFAELALKCVSKSREVRPTMVDVAKQLRKIYHCS